MKTINRLLTILACDILLGAAACGTSAPPPTATPEATATPAPTIQPGDSTRTLMVGDLERNYLLHIPPGMIVGLPVPLVFVFHGATEDLSYIQTITGFNDIADKNSFILVYPIGYSRSWNAPGCCGAAVRENIDDISFVRQMLADLATIVPIDPKRIYASGFSNGGDFSYRLACEMSDTFAAIGSVAGNLYLNSCQPQQPISVVHVHGTSDRLAPYAGGWDEYSDPHVFLRSIEQVIATWAQLDGCSGVAQVEKQGVITHIAYAGCKSGTAVELYTIEGGRHAWPNPYASPTINSQVIWDFFKAHPKP